MKLSVFQYQVIVCFEFLKAKHLNWRRLNINLDIPIAWNDYFSPSGVQRVASTWQQKIVKLLF